MSRYMNDAVMRRLRQESIDADSDKPSRVETLARDISNRQRQQSDGIKRRETNTNLAGTRAGESRTGALAAYLAEDGQRAARGRGSLPGTSQAPASSYLTGGGQPASQTSYGARAGGSRTEALAAGLAQKGGPPTVPERLGAAAKSIGYSLAGSVPMLGSLAKQYDTNFRADLVNPERQALLNENETLNNRLNAIRQGYGNAAWGTEADIRAQMDANRARLQGDLRTSNTVKSGLGLELMRKSGEQQERALEGTTGIPRFLGSNAISIANNAPAMLTGPFAPLVMAIQAAAQKGYELNEQGVSPEEALVRGAVSGGIEALTEKYSVENFWKIAEGTGAKTAIKNLWRQAGVEASEESASYALNYLADKAARDPEATFSLSELAESAAGGALSGGFYGGVGLAVNRLGQPRTGTPSDAVRQEAAQALPTRPQAQGDTLGAAARGTRENGAQAQQQGVSAPALQTAPTSYADSLGENGRQNLAWLQERTGRNDPDFLADHKTSYELGRNGTSEEQFRQMSLAGTLSRDDLYTAFSAGHNDGLSEASETVRRLSVGEAVSDAALDRVLAFPETRREIEKRVGQLPGVNSQDKAAVRSWVEKQAAKPGLVRNNFSTGLDEKTAERVDRLAKRAGVSVMFSDQLGDAAGAYQDGKITLRAGTENPEMKVFVHELTHHLETSGAYQAFSDLIVQHVEQDMGVDFRTLTQQQIDEYAQFGDTLTEDGARRELVAKFAEDYLFTNERSIQRLARENCSLAQKIRDWLHGFVFRFTSSREVREEARFLRQAEKLYEKALDSAEGQQTGETQNKIVPLPDGRKYVKADRQVIRGEDSRQWLKQSERFINEKIRNGNDLTVFSADGNEIQITERSAYKLTDSHVQSIRKADRTELAAEKQALKSRIAGHIDEVIQTAEKFKSRPDVNGKHQNDIGEDGFNYYAAYFEDTDGQYYRVILSSGVNASEETAYSIGDIQKRKHPTNNGSSASKGGALGVQVLSENSIAQSEDEGKQNLDDSQKSQGASFKELERQAEVIDYLRGQMKRTKGLKADPKQVKALAGELLNEYSSGYDKAEFSTALQTLYDSFANRTDAGAFAEMQQQARTLARGVLEESSVLNDETARDYSQLRAYLKKTPLTISDADKADVPGGFGEFRKAHMGRLRLTNDGLAVDSAYMELNADFGEALFPSDITHPADQLAQIADVLDALEPVYENPFSRNMEEAASGLANDMIARLFKVQQAKPTFADRQAAKLEKLELQKDWLRAKDLHEQKKQSDAKIEKLMEENRQRVKKAVEKERAARDKKLSDLKEKHKEQDANRRDRTSRAELRRRIERHAGKLSKKLLNPTDTQHVPEELRGAVAALLDQINLETAVQVDPVTGKRSRYQRDPETGKYKTRTVFDAETGKVRTEYVPLENGDLTKRTEAFRKLRDEYKKIIDESIDMVVDPDLPDNLDKAVSYHAKRLEDMSLEELQTVWDVLRAAEASISRAGKLLREGRFKTIQGIGAAFEKEGKRRAKDRIRFSGVLDTVDSSLNIDMMKPWAYFYTLGEGGEAVYDSFREAQDQKIRDLKVIQDFSQKLRGDTNIDEWTGRGAKTTIFETSGGKIEMTPAQVMSLYKLMQRPQAQEHIKEGGIRPTAIQRGVIERTAGAPVKVTIEDVTKIVSTLTDEQKRIADGFGEFMSGTLADWGNETSMALYGYKKFREENYFPIQSDKNQVKEELGQDGLDMRVKQKGWTKATVKGANNAVMIDDIFDVFAKHADEMSTYHSSLPALEDASRVFNFKYIDANGKPNGSVKDTIDSILGKHGQDYYRKLFNDLNGGIRSEGSSWLFGNFKAAAVGGNMRVVMQQPTAYARAYAEMDLKYLLGGLLHRGNFQEMIEHSPIAQWKAWGYNQTDLGRPIKDIFIDQRNLLRKFTDTMMKPAEIMDNLTWTRLWNACKLEIQDTTTLEKGSDAYWKAVAKRFDKVIDRTQVVDSVLQRSQMMRSTNGLTRMSTSFMAEPTTSYNLLHVSGVDAIQRKPNAGKKFARVTMAVLLGSAATALAAALADAARGAGDDDDDKNFWERYKEAAAGNFMDQINPAGLHPVLKDVLSLLQGYDVKRTDMTLIADVVQASRTLLRAQSGEGKVTVPAALAELLLKCSKVFGLPVANIKRDVAAIMNTTLEGLQAAGVNTYGVRFRWDMFKTAQNEGTASWWMNQAFAARDGGDPETAEEIFKMLHDKQLKTREEIRDYEKNVWNKDKNELVKRAFEAQTDGDDEGFQMYIDALRGMGLDDEEIEEALGGKADKARQDEFDFRDYRSDIAVRIQDEAYDSPGYEMLDKEHRQSFENAVRTYSGNITKDAKIEDFDIDSKWVIACRDAQKECGLSESKFIVAYAATRGIKSLKDKDGKTIDDSPGLLKMQAINKIPGLNDKQKRYMYEACGVGKEVIGFNPGRVEQELMKMEKQAAK